ncbi:MAG: acyltransferase [Lachnospiraceae bacterium]|nr:acyltransferase [Lachnospiraceae bacterium]
MLIKRIRVALISNGIKRTEYLVKNQIFAQTGENFYFCPRKIPADPKLIRFHDNVAVATEVLFINHDVIQKVFNFCKDKPVHKYYGCIEIMDNVFIGARSTILPNVRIGPNVIIAADSVVTKDITESGIYGGNPARKIGDFDELYRKRLEYTEKYFSGDSTDFKLNLWEDFYKEKDRSI